MTEPQPLTEEALKEIEAWQTNSYGSMVNLPVAKRDALCQTVRAAWATIGEWELHRDGIIEAVKTAEARVNELEAENAALREQLAQVNQKYERLADRYRSADVHVAALLNARCGSGPTHLSIEHSLSIIDGQFDALWNNAATRMREKCVDAIKSLRAVPHGAAYNNAVNDAIHKIESLALDQVEKKQ